MEAVRGRHKNPPVTLDEPTARLDRAGAKAFAAELRRDLHR